MPGTPKVEATTWTVDGGLNMTPSPLHSVLFEVGLVTFADSSIPLIPKNTDFCHLL